MKKTLFLIFILTISCTNKRELLNGHWHQFTPNNKEFTNCYNFTDSTFASDKETIGGNNFIELGEYNTLKKAIFYSTALNGYELDSTLRIQLQRNKIIINDTIIWKKPENNIETFLSEFSSGLQVKINPIKTTDTLFDYTIDNSFEIKIYIGKKKNSSSSKYYIQLNDKLATIDRVRNFVFCRHCDESGKILIYAGKDTPKTLLDSVENEIRSVNVNANQIYYLTVNPEKRLSGFNRRK